MNIVRTPLLIVILLVSILLGAACSAASPREMSTAAPAAAPAAMPADSLGMSPSYQEAEASAEMLPASQVARKVIANASMTLVVADTQAAVGQIEAMLEGVGGYIANTNFYKSSYSGSELLRGSMTLRIPAEQLRVVMDQLRGLAMDVRGENITREDVTDQYSDVEAQLRNLRATEDELRALLAEVREKPNSTPDDIMAVHYRITEIRGQIEQLQGRQNMLDNLVSLSTLNIELIPDALNQPIVETGWRASVIVRDATRALVSTLQFLGSAAIWIGVYLIPLALIALIPLSIIVWGLRRLARRLSSKSAAQSGV
ncbi:MAG: DUF4349 domain-containing protein [Caldilineaceae bacterium]|nr:DUF4349 domain-containing protein [Caldilineaceae bacterium]